MASIKEEEMAAKTDCQYVRALDANGNSIRISKEDLAKVLGELIGIRLYPKTTLKIGESIEIALSGKSPFILSIYAGEANNTEYLATYIINWASIYAASSTKLSEYSYTNNVVIELNRSGINNFKILYKSGNVDSVTVSYCLRKLL